MHFLSLEMSTKGFIIINILCIVHKAIIIFMANLFVIKSS